MFKLTITNGQKDCELIFKVRGTEIAKKWFCELEKNYDLYETDRFTNWNDKNYIEQLNNIIDIINQYDSIIDRKVSKETKQQDLNYLHKFFEDLRGESEISTIWFKSAPKEIKEAVTRFNVLIHSLEEEIRTNKKYPTIVVTFKDRPRYKLDLKDMKHFTFKWQQGTVYINYCHVGKPILDAYKDQDNLTEAIRPQTHYSADFLIKFGPPTLPWVYYLRKMFIEIWLAVKGMKFDHYNIGMIPVADLVGDLDIEYLRNFNRVKSVECLK